ncbi:Di-copper centre-containing protein [Poronia punctata]|nr:Di-copper centre-containing protein [Poronia punctata]
MMAIWMLNLVVLASILVSGGFARLDGMRGYDYGPKHRSNTHLPIHSRGFSQSSVVGSLPLVEGKPQQRLEIRDLEKDEDLWNLYLLALSWMQYTDQESPFSWYQIAGIHGAPGSTWGDVEPLPGNEKIGYCRHVSILFLTWHRPYLVLYEQILYNIVQFIASLWPPEQLGRMQKAAKRFRIPYWDWAAAPSAGESVLPLSVGGSSTISVSGPNGVQNISNPLFSFTFRPFNMSYFQDAPFNRWNETKRAPSPNNGPDAVSNNSFVAASFDNHLPSYQQRLYNLFANSPNYTHFSNEAWIGRNSTGAYYDSLESLHDSIHTVGGGTWGHLAIIAYSAFDPIFFLHHANVDRIFAMWQVIHNDTYVVPSSAVYASHTQNTGDVEDSQSPLEPFFQNGSAFWTSDMVRDHEIFGYTYAEVMNGSRADVVTAINRLYTDYSPASISLKRSGERFSRAEGLTDGGGTREPVGQRIAPRPRAVSWHYQSSDDLPTGVLFSTNTDGYSYREWVANVKATKHGLGTSFLIYLFLGSIPDNSSSWQRSDALVGSFGVFAGQGRSVGPEEGSIAGAIPLTAALVKMVAEGRLRTLEADDVKPFLQSALVLRVALINGTVIPADGVDGLDIHIASSLVKAPTRQDELPIWGETEWHFNLVA